MAAAAFESGQSPRQLSMAAALQTLEAFRGELQRAEAGSAEAAVLVKIVRVCPANRVTAWTSQDGRHG